MLAWAENGASATPGLAAGPGRWLAETADATLLAQSTRRETQQVDGTRVIGADVMTAQLDTTDHIRSSDRREDIQRLIE